MMASGLTADSFRAPSGIEAVRASALRKIFFRMVPILAFAHFINYLDRVNVGYAALTMNRDIGLTATQFGFGAGIFFLGYCAAEVPSSLALYRFGPRVWLTRIMLSWGLVSAATAFAVGPNSYAIIRVIVGIAEAGSFPGTIYLLSMFIPVQHRSKMLAWLFLAVPLSSIVGGPLSTWILQMDGMWGLRGWQWMFIIEGMPACVCGILTFTMLSDTLETAKWLTPEERQALSAELKAEKREREKTSFWSILTDSRVLLLSSMAFFWTVAIQGINIWMPLILKGFGGLSNLEIGFLTAIPNLIGCAVMIPWAGHVDKTRGYIKNFALAVLLAAVGCVGSVIFHSLAVAMIGLTLAIIGITVTRPMIYAIPARFLTGAAAAGGLGVINGIGNLGGFAGTYILGWTKDLTGQFSSGMFALAFSLIICAGLTLLLKFTIKQE
jgi:ACS family tartrate transporter-like MFS transporter